MALERPALLGLLEDLHRFAKGQPPAPTSTAALGPDPQPFLPYVLRFETLASTHTPLSESLTPNQHHLADSSQQQLQPQNSYNTSRSPARPSSAPRPSRAAAQPAAATASVRASMNAGFSRRGTQEGGMSAANSFISPAHLPYNYRPLGSRALAASGYVAPPSAAATLQPRPVSANRALSRDESVPPSPPQQQPLGYYGAQAIVDELANSPQRMIWPGLGNGNRAVTNVRPGEQPFRHTEQSGAGVQGGGGKRPAAASGNLRLIPVQQQQQAFGSSDDVAGLAHRSDRLVSVVYGQ